MAITLLYFAWVREAVGRAEETVTLPDTVATIGDLVGWLAARGGGYAQAFAEPARLRAAINDVFVHPDAALAGAREVALFPPVTGG